jgi:hypothetical protein
MVILKGDEVVALEQNTSASFMTKLAEESDSRVDASLDKTFYSIEYHQLNFSCNNSAVDATRGKSLLYASTNRQIHSTFVSFRIRLDLRQNIGGNQHEIVTRAGVRHISSKYSTSSF